MALIFHLHSHAWKIGLVLLGLFACQTSSNRIYGDANKSADDLAAIEQGKVIRHLLLTAIANASVIRVVEHSSISDQPPPNLQYKEIIFADLTLKPEQIKALCQALPPAADYSGIMHLNCSFDEHHYVEIKEKNGSVLTLHLCFQCGELRLNNDGQEIMPEGWESSLNRFIASLGMHPNGPWPPQG